MTKTKTTIGVEKEIKQKLYDLKFKMKVDTLNEVIAEILRRNVIKIPILTR